jgi:hypothetical protein
MKDNHKSLWQKLFGDSVRAFGVVSLVFLASLAIAPAKNHFSEWRHYQHGYLNLIRNRSDAVTLRRHFQGGIQQIWLPELGVHELSRWFKRSKPGRRKRSTVSPASADSA